MNTLWNRIKYTVQADLHTVLDKKESKNPIAMLNQYVKEAEKQTDAVGKLLERQGKLKVALEKEYAEAKAMLDKRSKQLALAESTGEEDLVAFAQDEVQAYETRAVELANSITESAKELVALERKFEEMKHKVKDMKVRQLQLMGKENVTRAHRRMDKFISPENGDKQVSSVEEMNSYIENLGGEINREYESSSMERRLELLEKKATKNAEIV
ncbi:PspA/IM30 family protein [Sporosarcina thermotolerans]|uniref:PspA/IM30 family protein n=1 Tax=Sporosarcina thermotolerans TaxID=633404 RepID=A0AAW9AEQ3_9BACL|nr:PspA/IM30 family protein [Sporosarcina thermotolerans]MDW0118830.1 PspA/IM30 family protein [Sporosarcina thermotolerans]WHT48520.1 PspA/IM30 family protein [Sporosarcina thermotolerans]